MNAKDLIERYGRSHFDVFVPVERVITPAERKAAVKEYERDPVKALLENVDTARDDIRFTGERLQRAIRDGLFEEEPFKAANKEDRKKLIAAMATIRGDYIRAKAELAHWRSYVQWAAAEQHAKVALLEAPDRRLPPEAA